MSNLTQLRRVRTNSCGMPIHRNALQYLRYQISFPENHELPMYRFQPSRIQYRFPSSPSTITNFSHLASLPAPTTRSSSSEIHPITPLGGLEVPSVVGAAPSAGSSGTPPTSGSSPASNGAEANEYTSEKTRGISGIFPRMPHRPLPPSSPVVELGLPGDDGPKCPAGGNRGLDGAGG